MISRVTLVWKRVRHDSQTDMQGYGGGIATAINQQRKVSEKEGESSALIHCLHPSDLVPFTRKPLFVIVDSTNSGTFKVNLGKAFICGRIFPVYSLQHLCVS